MKTTLLQIVQSILSDMDSEEVNSISDTVEAQQIASVVEDTYYNIVAAREIPEHNTLLTLTSLVDSTRPTHFEYPFNVAKLHTVEYNVGTINDPNYKEILFLEPFEFIKNMDQDGLQVRSKEFSIPLYVSTDRPPTYYTSFDDKHIVMDSYDSSVEVTLAQFKTRAFGKTLPNFSQTDAFEPDLDNTLMPLLLAEAKSTCFSLFKGGPDPKIEQASRRLKSYIQNDQYKTRKANTRNNYGRT
jgi:hypothetical protein